jgi:hypothetical protein
MYRSQWLLGSILLLTVVGYIIWPASIPSIWAVAIYSTMAEALLHHTHLDNWLNIVTRKPGVSSLREDHVVCLVERVCVQVSFCLARHSNFPQILQPPDNGTGFVDQLTYILYITAHRSSMPHAPSFLRQSPWATLGRFVGHPSERSAPHWTRWAEASDFFFHRTASFTRLFREMASWKVNSDQVG